MAHRILPNTEKSLPCANLILLYPVKLNFSCEPLIYEKWKKLVKKDGNTINKELTKWFLKLFNTANFDKWKIENKNAASKLDSNIKKVFRDELGLGTKELSSLFKEKVENDLKNE